MLHQQVQQQELCSFVSDTFSVSGAPGGAKDRSALSLTSCCLLTFSCAHYYIIVTVLQCFIVAAQQVQGACCVWVRAIFLHFLDSLPNSA